MRGCQEVKGGRKRVKSLGVVVEGGSVSSVFRFTGEREGVSGGGGVVVLSPWDEGHGQGLC